MIETGGRRFGAGCLLGLAFLACSLTALLLPAAAGAATVKSVALPGGGPGSAPDLQFVAAPGEANDVTFIVPDRSAYPNQVTVRDVGAVLEAGFGCARVDPHTAVCESGAGPIVALGDRDDRIDTESYIGVLEVRGGLGDDQLLGLAGDLDIASEGQGGPGNDVIACSPPRRDSAGLLRVGDCDVDGGPGADRITGSDGDDEIAGGAGDDVLVGGAGSDIVDYSDHRRSVRVDLSGSQTFKAVGERDQLDGFEVAAGGAGDDVLIGSAADAYDDFVTPQCPYGMSGGRGNDRIVVRSRGCAVGGAGNDRISGATDTYAGFDGGSGRDRLIGSKGPDVLDGGPGNDRLAGRGGSDSLDCGSGRRDRALIDRRDRITGCERRRRQR